jgi:hypothetical protein
VLSPIRDKPAVGEAIYTPPTTPLFGRNATDKESKTIVVRIKAKDQAGKRNKGGPRALRNSLSLLENSVVCPWKGWPIRVCDPRHVH